MSYWRFWKYKNLTFISFGILLAYLLSQNEQFHQFLLALGDIGYLGAFIAGMLFVSTFTVATGAVILLVLAENLSIIEIGIIAGFGAVLGDFTIFRFIKNTLLEEVTPLYNHLGGRHLTRIFNSRYFHWTLPVVGALIIASPFPDELGISLMGISKMKTYKFLIISFILNTIGIMLILSASAVIKP